MIQKLLVTTSGLLLIASPAIGQEFTETFEGGIPASWTIQDNFPVTGSPDFSAVPWTVNTAEGMLNYTGGTGLAATASSKNHPGQYDVSLITPPFAITADAFGDNLAYTINLQRVDASEYFDTNLSINGGPWITMVHDMSSLGPAYDTGPPKIARGIDMGFFGAMPGDSVRVEFRYYSTFLLPMVHNEYVEIDNVRFPAIPVPEPTTLVSVLFGVALTSCRRGRRLPMDAAPVASELR